MTSVKCYDYQIGFLANFWLVFRFRQNKEKFEHRHFLFNTYNDFSEREFLCLVQKIVCLGHFFCEITNLEYISQLNIVRIFIVLWIMVIISEAVESHQRDCVQSLSVFFSIASANFFFDDLSRDDRHCQPVKE